jgi:riboflavin biosynthesis pyrimidine reductase
VTPVVITDSGGLPHAFEQLLRLGIRRISCIGGRRFASSLLDAGLVDDLYLTTAPRPGGEPDTALPASALGGETVVRKRGTGEDAGVVFEHRALRSGR